MAQIKKFEDLTIWKESRILVEQTYLITRQATFSKDLQLVDHIRRTAVSIPSNIAEGFERDGTKEFNNFLSIAKGSCGELKSQLYLAKDQKYINQDQFDELQCKIDELTKSIASLMRYLQKCSIKGLKFK